jgi:type IV secretory pathway VirB2 component (pilin)
MNVSHYDIGQARSRELRRSVLITLLVVGLAAVPLWDADAGSTGVGDVLCRAIGLINGSLGRALCTAAIIAVGVAALFGKASWGMAALVAVGVGALSNAYSITVIILNLDPRQVCTD